MNIIEKYPYAVHLYWKNYKVEDLLDWLDKNIDKLDSHVPNQSLKKGYYEFRFLKESDALVFKLTFGCEKLNI